jgi:hypothetical protein
MASGYRGMTTKLFLALALAACVDSNTVDTTSTAEFCRAAATTGCTTMYTCLTDAERTMRKLPATEPECERKLKASCESALDMCPTSTHAYAPSTAQTCLDQMALATCSDAGQDWLDAKACADVCERTGGAFGISWRFEPAYTCAQLMVASVRVVSTSGGQTFVDDFQCDASDGITAVVPVGDYAVHIELYDIHNAKVWSSAAANHSIDADVVDVGTVVVPVSAQ